MTPPRPAVLLIAMVLTTLLCSGSSCGGAPAEGEGEGEGEGEDFEDHTSPSVDTEAAFEAIATDGPSSTALKFVITRFLSDAQNVHFLHGDHYTLHDEWWWFRLMNGAPIDGVAIAPVDVGRSFATVQDIVAWARTRDPSTLPLDLTFVQDGTRLYSPMFYSLALNVTPKVLGLGTVLHFPARPEAGLAEQWAIELEFSHVLDENELVHFFEALEAALPNTVGTRLKLLVRSAQQEELARALEDAGSPLAARFLRYSEVTVPGDVEVYAEGLTAGRLRIVRRGEPLEGTLSTDVLILEDVPDFLPQCAGLVTGVPQTALAHVNILAKNRGIPNAYRGGILEDPNLDQLARIRAPVIIKARGADQLVIRRITEAEFTQYRQLSAIPDLPGEPVSIDGIAQTYDLEALSFADQDTWRPVLGGKSAGYLALLDAGDITTPHRPTAISIAPFVRHTEALNAQIELALADVAFQGDPNLRFVVLEGPDRWAALRPDDPEYPARLIAARPVGDPVRALIEAGGVTQVVRDRPIDGVDLEGITAGLEDAFGIYAPEQGLRFRSSSNIEDAEGFNGAGLYTSNTGYLRADELSGSKRDETVEWAIKETWASYWGFEAFEERRLARADHLLGSMGIVVHASIPDEIELSNGVFTFTVLPPDHPAGDAVLEVNVQEGALSVTNPPPGDTNLPEVDRVVADGDSLALARVRGSTLLPAGDVVLSDAQLLQLFDEAARVTALWLATENDALPASQRRSTLTLDFELREVREGWPRLASTNQYGSRVVVKQARTLEPSLVRVPAIVQAMPFPRDVLARARRIEQRRCEGESAAVIVTDAITDPTKAPDMGFAVAPFTGFVIVEMLQAVEGLPPAGARRSVNHTAYSATRPGMAEGGPWAIDAVIDPAAAVTAGFDALSADDDSIRVAYGDAVLEEAATCTTLVLHASPEDFLEGLLPD